MSTTQVTQSWKTSTPVKIDGIWRILRHDGVLVGFYASREFAQREIDRAGYLQ